ncbi:MAG: hypothetical protein J3K34DRAFT_443007 [Monoraphidium minutum]|nr:MAG: hypothetical protein J3K34DRAFT_443007 [Monoraphidium minutum]
MLSSFTSRCATPSACIAASVRNSGAAIHAATNASGKPSPRRSASAARRSPPAHHSCTRCTWSRVEYALQRRGMLGTPCECRYLSTIASRVAMRSCFWPGRSYTLIATRPTGQRPTWIVEYLPRLITPDTSDMRSTVTRVAGGWPEPLEQSRPAPMALSMPN